MISGVICYITFQSDRRNLFESRDHTTRICDQHIVVDIVAEITVSHDVIESGPSQAKPVAICEEKYKNEGRLESFGIAIMSELLDIEEGDPL